MPERTDKVDRWMCMPARTESTTVESVLSRSTSEDSGALLTAFPASDPVRSRRENGAGRNVAANTAVWKGMHAGGPADMASVPPVREEGAMARSRTRVASALARPWPAAWRMTGAVAWLVPPSPTPSPPEIEA
jgi:hypothetical protein